MNAMSLRDKLSLAIFLLAIAGGYGLEIVLWARYIVARVHHQAGTGEVFSGPAVVLHVIAGAGIVCFLYARFVAPYRLEVNQMTIRTAKLRDTGFRIVQISDLHCDDKPGNEERAIEIINQLKPDVIVATGDYLNRASALPRLRDTLRRIEAPLGKFAIRGSFEVGRWFRLDLLDHTGFRLLEQDTVAVRKVDDVLDVCGLSVDRPEACRDLLRGAGSDRFRIFLFHTPDLIEDVNGLGVDLYLCGHTHGGQVALPWYGAIITLSKFGKKYESGLYRLGGTTLYVNRGLGLERAPAPQVRFFARPEIAVFDIVPENSP
jgi:predicted MPP superfamily phosphohydrolase